MRVRALPVLYSCQGCAMYGQRAKQAAESLERLGAVESAWTGTPGLSPKARFPIWAIDGCADGCALRWLAQHGIRADRHYVLEPGAADIAL